MLEFYFSYRGVLKRLRDGALGAEMERIAGRFFSLGYKQASAKLYLSRIARFSRFAAAHCASRPIGDAIVDSYLCTFTTDSPRIAAVSTLQHARRVAPERFIASTPIVVDDPDAPLLSSFSDYLSRVRGLEPRSRDGVLLGARRFLDWLRHRHPGQELETLTAERSLPPSSIGYRSRRLRHSHGGDLSHPSVSPLSALGWPPPAGSGPRRSKNAPLASGPFAARAVVG